MPGFIFLDLNNSDLDYFETPEPVGNSVIDMLRIALQKPLVQSQSPRLDDGNVK